MAQSPSRIPVDDLFEQWRCLIAPIFPLVAMQPAGKSSRHRTPKPRRQRLNYDKGRCSSREVLLGNSRHFRAIPLDVDSQ